jgi:hypothetical protein
LLIVFADDSVSVFHKTNFVTESLDWYLDLQKV